MHVYGILQQFLPERASERGAGLANRYEILESVSAPSHQMFSSYWQLPFHRVAYWISLHTYQNFLHISVIWGSLGKYYSYTVHPTNIVMVQPYPAAVL